MLTSVPRQRPPLLSAVFDHFSVDLTGRLARSREQAARRRAEALVDRMPPELLDDLGLLYDTDGCLTELGLIQAARQLRKGWS
jgi:hypothetical protein